jgi:hypothetical protein
MDRQDESKVGWLERRRERKRLKRERLAIRPRSSRSVTRRERPPWTGCCGSEAPTEKADLRTRTSQALDTLALAEALARSSSRETSGAPRLGAGGASRAPSVRPTQDFETARFHLATGGIGS